MDPKMEKRLNKLDEEIAELQKERKDIQTKISFERDNNNNEAKIADWKEEIASLNAQIEKYQDQQNTILGNFYFYFIYFILFISFDFFVIWQI